MTITPTHRLQEGDLGIYPKHLRERPPIDTYFMRIAEVVKTRATCGRRQVGAVFVNTRRHILATGYNGPASKMPHCTEVACPGRDFPSGQGLDLCEAVHAEQNALLQCHDVRQITTAYVTASPCVTCLKLLLNTSCEVIVYNQVYPGFEKVSELWTRAGRGLIQQIV